MRIHAVAKGRVQGVFFRDGVKKLADSIDIKGWIRNNPDGTVECVCEGEDEAIREMEEFLHKGPPGADIDECIIEEDHSKEKFDRFEIKN